MTWNRPKLLPSGTSSVAWSSIAFIDDKSGYAVGEKGMLVVTGDGGETWQKIPVELTEDFNEILLNRSLGIIVGTESVYRFTP